MHKLVKSPRCRITASFNMSKLSLVTRTVKDYMKCLRFRGSGSFSICFFVALAGGLASKIAGCPQDER